MGSTSYKEIHSAPQMSLLSLTLLADAGSTSPRIPVMSSSHIETTKNDIDTTRFEVTSEPPCHLQEVGGLYSLTPLKDRVWSTSAVQSRNRIKKLSQCSLTLIGASPLTSCSYSTISKEYDMDTWRMYNRIQEARSQKSGGCFPGRQNRDELKEEDETLQINYSEPTPPTALIELSYNDEIFDLDL